MRLILGAMSGAVGAVSDISTQENGPLYLP